LGGALKVGLYARVSHDAQTTENQLRDLREIGQRLGWTVVAEFIDHGISGARGRDKRPAYDQMLKGIARRDFDLVATWAIDRLGRSLHDLVGLLSDLQVKNVGLFVLKQSLDTTSPSGRLMFQLCAVFSEYERCMIQARVMSGLARARANGTRLGRPPLAADKVAAITAALGRGTGTRRIAKALRVGVGTVLRTKARLAAANLKA
jgi:DNA invertase Pin-like site-specific DNA recombinase